MTAAVANNQGQDPHPRKMWQPTNIENKEMEKFRVYVNQKYSLSLGKCEGSSLLHVRYDIGIPWVPSSDPNLLSLSLFANTVNYEDLWQWSVTKIGDFWTAVWEYTNVIASTLPSGPVSLLRMFPESFPLADQSKAR